MAKLIVIGIILGFFGVVLLVVQHNYRREMRDRATRVPTLDDQLDVLTRAGLPMAAGLSREDLLAWRPEQSYRHDPWRLLLLTLACRADDGRPLSPRAALVDMTGPVPTEELARITGHRPEPTDLETALANCARALPDGSGLYRLDNGTDVALFVLPPAGAERIEARVPGLLTRI